MVSKGTRIWLIGMIFLSASCAPRVEVSKEGARSEKIAPSALISATEKYDEREVVVRGYLQVGPEARGLWDSKEDMEAANFRRACVTVYNPHGLKIAGDVRLVDVHGIFHARRPPNLIILGDCTDSILEVERVDEIPQ